MVFIDFEGPATLLRTMRVLIGTRAAVVLVLGVLSASVVAGADVRTVVGAFVGRVATADLRDLIIDQTLDVYDPQGRYRQARIDQRLFIKMPGRQRLEQTVDGVREVQIIADGRMWSRQGDGKVEAGSIKRQRDTARLLLPVARSIDDVLGEWRALGVRQEVAHTSRLLQRPVTIVGAFAGDRESPSVWLDDRYGVIRLVTREKLPTGPALVDLTFSEHRPLTGDLFFPYRQEAFVNGRLQLLIVVRSIAVNTKLADTLFDPNLLTAR